MKALFATLFVSLVAINSPAFGQTPERKDLQVFNDIADQVNRYTQLTIFDSISASVDNGHVALSGWVTMILTVHDELLFEAPEDEAADVAALVTDKMSNAVKLNVPLDVDAGIGKNWTDAKH